MIAFAPTFNRQATRVDAITGRYDPVLMVVGAFLIAFGIVMVGSASFPMAVDDGHSPFYFLERHVFYVGVGLTLAWLVMQTELKFIEQHSKVLPLLCILLLLVVAVPGLGVTVKGARRWINLGFVRFQPVELVKLMMIVWLASYLVRFRDEVNGTWKAMIKALAVALFLGAILLVVQKDFGSTALLFAITAGMLVLGGVHMPRMLIPAVLALPAMALMILMEPYRMKRLVSYLNPWEDPLGSGYQLTNALMAIGRGGFWGVGLGGSVQKMSYLPEAHTDFIMAVISEELGFVGVCVVIAMYMALVGRAFHIGLKCVDMRRYFAGFCAFGIGLWMALQSFISIGVNLGLLPTKGLTLPFISSGGSSLMMACAALGLLLRISYELDRAERQVAVRRADPVPSAAREHATESRTQAAAVMSGVVSGVQDKADAAGAALAASVSRLLRRSGNPPRTRVEPAFDTVDDA